MLKYKDASEAKTFEGKKLRKALPENMRVDCTFFLNYISPKGFLDNNAETHALFFYYLHARRTYESFIRDEPLVLEGDPDHSVDFYALFKSIAALYDVEPEHMINAWPQIDKQCELIGCPKLPYERQYRFTSSIILLN